MAWTDQQKMNIANFIRAVGEDGFVDVLASVLDGAQRDALLGALRKRWSAIVEAKKAEWEGRREDFG